MSTVANDVLIRPTHVHGIVHESKRKHHRMCGDEDYDESMSGLGKRLLREVSLLTDGDNLR